MASEHVVNAASSRRQFPPGSRLHACNSRACWRQCSNVDRRAVARVIGESIPVSWGIKSTRVRASRRVVGLRESTAAAFGPSVNRRIVARRGPNHAPSGHAGLARRPRHYPRERTVVVSRERGSRVLPTATSMFTAPNGRSARAARAYRDGGVTRVAHRRFQLASSRCGGWAAQIPCRTVVVDVSLAREGVQSSSHSDFKCSQHQTAVRHARREHTDGGAVTRVGDRHRRFRLASSPVEVGRHRYCGPGDAIMPVRGAAKVQPAGSAAEGVNSRVQPDQEASAEQLDLTEEMIADFEQAFRLFDTVRGALPAVTVERPASAASAAACPFPCTDPPLVRSDRGSRRVADVRSVQRARTLGRTTAAPLRPGSSRRCSSLSARRSTCPTLLI